MFESEKNAILLEVRSGCAFCGRGNSGDLSVISAGVTL